MYAGCYCYQTNEHSCILCVRNRQTSTLIISNPSEEGEPPLVVDLILTWSARKLASSFKANLKFGAEIYPIEHPHFGMAFYLLQGLNWF